MNEPVSGRGEPTCQWGSLRVITRLWLAKATGILRTYSDPDAQVMLIRGGLASVDDAACLARLVEESGLHFHPAAVSGASDRWLMARLITQLAVNGVRANLPRHCGQPEVKYLVPEASLEELGLLATDEDPADERLARVLAMERLGVARVWFPGVLAGTPSTVESVPDGLDAELLARLGIQGSELENINAGLFEEEGDDPTVSTGLETADGLMARGQWRMAERVLEALHAHRLDHPRVLAVLALVKVADATRLDADRLAEARRCLEMAELFGAGWGEVGGLLRDVRSGVARAEAMLMLGAHRMVGANLVREG